MAECVRAKKEKHIKQFGEEDECYDHRMQTLRYMIIVKLYSRTSYNNREGKKVAHRARK